MLTSDGCTEREKDELLDSFYWMAGFQRPGGIGDKAAEIRGLAQRRKAAKEEDFPKRKSGTHAKFPLARSVFRGLETGVERQSGRTGNAFTPEIRTLAPRIRLFSLVDMSRALVDMPCALVDMSRALVDMSRALVDMSRALMDMSRALVNMSRALVNMSRALVDLSQALVDLSRALVDLSRAQVDLSRALVEKQEIPGILVGPWRIESRCLGLSVYSLGADRSPPLLGGGADQLNLWGWRGTICLRRWGASGSRVGSPHRVEVDCRWVGGS